MEKKKIKLLAIQMSSVIADRDNNIKKVQDLLNHELSSKDVDFVFLPEVWTCGWDCLSFVDSSENIDDSKAILMLQEIARKYNVNIVGGSFIQRKNDGTYVNACPVINRKGELVCTYEKNHLYSYYGCDEGRYITKGTNPVLVELDGVKVGITICYDIRFPEIFRAYRMAGADILVNMAAWGAEKRIPWVSMSTSRAVENQTYFVALTQTGDLRDGKKNLGYSMILDYNGNILSEINEVEGGIYTEIDLQEMYEFREKCTVLNDLKESYEVISV